MKEGKRMDWPFEKSPAELAHELQAALSIDIADSQEVLDAVRRVFIDGHPRVSPYSRLPANWPKLLETSGKSVPDDYRLGFNAAVTACLSALKTEVRHDENNERHHATTSGPVAPEGTGCGRECGKCSCSGGSAS
jgi:hypothetical protein